ncbi:Ig-like domain-containing protein [Carboxylicivirga marina]|uniref:Ig-like domain-containing protein n=1 Tax=Carboxylicivirga marina TaxID=2800988 RepID=A0ABS1HL90_9BACT|nr:Ig-like domain-containing protein [Carboxylicivirga marina]MBK3518317.1 Ig-like domain-containing protein [Carboxylicivirga marina]
MRNLCAVLGLLLILSANNVIIGQIDYGQIVFSPDRAAENISVNPIITLTFQGNTSVDLLEGNTIYIMATDYSHYISVTTSRIPIPPFTEFEDERVSVTGNSITIDLTKGGESLINDLEYAIRIPDGTIEVDDAYFYNELENYTYWTFKTEAAPIPPSISQYIPGNGDGTGNNVEGVALNRTLSLTFDTEISLGSGILRIKNSAGDELIEIPSDKLSIDGNTLSITHNDFVPESSYYILMEPGFVESTTGTPFGGISDINEWSFTTLGVRTWTGGGAASDWNDAGNWEDGNTFVDGSYLNINTETNGAILGSNADVYDLTIQNGGSLTIPSGTSLNVANEINLESDIYNNASLVILGDLTYDHNKVNITQNITSSNRTYHISSPVQNATFATIGSNVASYQWNNNNVNKWEATSATLSTGRGYAIRCDNSSNLVFSGLINEGNITLDVPAGVVTAYSVVGNPYTHAIDWDNVILSPEVPNMFWLWKNETGSFTAYNGEGGLYVNPIGEGSTGTASLIPSMHGFFVRTVDTENSGTIQLTDACKTRNEGSYLKSTQKQEYPYIKIAGVTEGNTDEVIIAFSSNEENIPKLNTAKRFSTSLVGPQPYFEHGGERLCIKGVPNTNGELIIPMSVRIDEVGSYSIEKVETRDLQEGYAITLEDLYTHVNTDLLNEGSYSFTCNSTGDITDRFQIRVVNTVATQIEQEVQQFSNIWLTDKIINVQLYSEEFSFVKVFDTTGRLIKSEEFIKDISLNVSESGLYIIHISNSKGNISQKILVK